MTSVVTVKGVFGRLYSFAPPGVASFCFFLKAVGQAQGRGGKLTVFGPDGKAAAHVEGDLGSWTELPVAVPAALQGRIWCLSGEELTNDLTVYFAPDDPSSYLSPDPAKVLTLRPQRPAGGGVRRGTGGPRSDCELHGSDPVRAPATRTWRHAPSRRRWR